MISYLNCDNSFKKNERYFLFSGICCQFYWYHNLFQSKHILLQLYLYTIDTINVTDRIKYKYNFLLKLMQDSIYILQAAYISCSLEFNPEFTISLSACTKYLFSPIWKFCLVMDFPPFLNGGFPLVFLFIWRIPIGSLDTVIIKLIWAFIALCYSTSLMFSQSLLSKVRFSFDNNVKIFWYVRYKEVDHCRHEKHKMLLKINIYG